ncbi:GntR family transcriptional regulator [Variovorax sp. YR216]|uniref:GntR family transcriptional regulator n=1 Tax=Variovorax sp. YR216 TaxID=1882828 RepID=UPI000898BE61|nr:GntR family transcriptional regulator [Variovorax sp. YR216]SEB22341.1 DNA-binding transcriptional regulator, GntR family [Variovorax sp. YR216]
MARKKTSNTPDLSSLLLPPTPIMVAVEHAILRRHEWSSASAPVAEQIAVRLAGVITLDLIHAGQRLLETEIGEVLRVSRAPVREALRILERERLVEFRPRRGVLVTEPGAKDIADIYVVRIALFKILLRQLMERRPADLEAVFDRHMPALAKASEQGSVDDYALESFLLNMDMLKLSEGGLIADMLASISLRILRYVRLAHAADPSRMATTMKSWRALHRAVARRDVEEVLATATRRIEVSRDSAVQAVVEGQAPAPLSGTAASTRARSQPSAPSRKSSAPTASRRRRATAEPAS